MTIWSKKKYFTECGTKILSFLLKRSPLSHILTGYKFANYALLEIRPLDIDSKQITVK